MYALLNLLLMVITLYMWAVIISAILSWLVAFNVINTHNPFINSVGRFLHQITDPALRRIRQFLPSMGGIDFSPIVLIIGLVFLRNLVGVDLAQFLLGNGVQ